MNLIIALEQLGYLNQTDFKVEWDENVETFVISEWNSEDEQPEETALLSAWNEWESTNGPTLDDFKTRASQDVDDSAETARQRYITPGAGQTMAYQEKSDEAADYAAVGYPADLSSYPFIQSEVNATGKSAHQAVDDILAKRSAWVTKGAAIEEIRVKAKLNIEAADSEDSINMEKDNAIAALGVV